MKKTKGKTKGKKPRKERVVHRSGEEALREAGYVTVADVVEMTGSAKPTVYGWVRRGLLVSKDPNRAATIKTADGFMWFLREAVEAFRPDPAKLVAAGG